MISIASPILVVYTFRLQWLGAVVRKCNGDALTDKTGPLKLSEPKVGKVALAHLWYTLF